MPVIHYSCNHATVTSEDIPTSANNVYNDSCDNEMRGSTVIVVYLLLFC